MELSSIFSETGIILAIAIVIIPVFVAGILAISKSLNIITKTIKLKEEKELIKQIDKLSENELKALLNAQSNTDFEEGSKTFHKEIIPHDSNKLLSSVQFVEKPPFIGLKKKNSKQPNIEKHLSTLILWYLGCATFWLVFGTTAGEYLGIKFLSPDVDQIPALSFGRLRPVHTNAVFWGWSSLAMIGFAYYVIPRVSNVPIHSIKKGYQTLILLNTTVILGTLCLMWGINNGGGEYREYIWPVMLPFVLGIILTLINFLKTIANRTTKEIYVSNWYIVSSLMFLLVISIVAYWPTWQNGLGETIIQGYYMHQGVGMWFMLFCLGLMYYFLPKQLKKPIYSYSLGVVAFWSQILFYTLIGTHHFIFSSIPWWLQTVAIVGSAGMMIPVIAGTTNFLMTFRGAWNKLASSYTLPFYLVGIVFYFTGSLQGTIEAFRFTNLLWHFTDFTVAHSHLTMYGIIAFMLWAFSYTLIPRLTGKEPIQVLVGLHFWFALIGLLFYTFPLMIGATQKGLLWMKDVPFMESVIQMTPYWLWRAIGGTMMWVAHLFFAYNFYKMVKKDSATEAKSYAVNKTKELILEKQKL